jgi:hypothetical protein
LSVHADGGDCGQQKSGCHEYKKSLHYVPAFHWTEMDGIAEKRNPPQKNICSDCADYVIKDREDKPAAGHEFSRAAASWTSDKECKLQASDLA